MFVCVCVYTYIIVVLILNFMNLYEVCFDFLKKILDFIELLFINIP
jgi:hypothetical protein